MTPIDSLLPAQLSALSEGETNPITIMANASALLFHALDAVNWAGVYLFSARTGTLDLGPFNGEVACTHIEPGKGVVGTAYAKNQALRVPDVHQFAGHIACDAASNAEIVLPLRHAGQVFGILDIDSTSFDRFSEADEQVLGKFADCLANSLDAATLAKVY